MGVESGRSSGAPDRNVETSATGGCSDGKALSQSSCRYWGLPRSAPGRGTMAEALPFADAISLGNGCQGCLPLALRPSSRPGLWDFPCPLCRQTRVGTLPTPKAGRSYPRSAGNLCQARAQGGYLAIQWRRPSSAGGSRTECSCEGPVCSCRACCSISPM